MITITTPQSVHARVAQVLLQMVECVVLGDWRTLSKDDVIQQTARLRTVKSQYILAHLNHHQEIQQNILGFLDQALLELYMLLDHLEGCNSEQQQDMYRALLAVQSPLLAAYASMPLHVPSPVEYNEHDPAMPTMKEDAPTIEKASQMTPFQKGQRFIWSPERLLALKEALVQHASLTAHAASMKIADQYDWPPKAVEYKVYALRKSSEQQRAANTERAEDAKEDD